MTKRFFYNPYSKKLSLFESDHVTFFHNRKNELGASFDEFIRGIIFENKILLRVFYPYENISELTYGELLEKSEALTRLNLPDIKKALKAQGVTPESFVLNVTNEQAKSILNALFV
jgi:hypothetical protein